MGCNQSVLLLTESPRPARVRRHPLAPWLVVATVSIGAFMGQLDASIVTLALPHIGVAFHASPAVVVWVSLSYLLVLVATLPAAGFLADRFGRKLLYIQGFVVFTAASLACGLAPDLGALVLARCVQGVGAALLQANSVALIREALSGDRLGRGLGVQGAAQAVGLAGGPAIGGLLLALGGWRLLFFVNIPAGMLGALAGIVLLPRSRSHRRGVRFDWRGAVLLAVAAGALMVVVSLGREPGFPPPLIAGLGILAVAAAAGFVVLERRVAAPRGRRGPRSACRRGPSARQDRSRARAPAVFARGAAGRAAARRRGARARRSRRRQRSRGSRDRRSALG